MVINNEHLKELEDEAIFVMREVAAQFEKKVILFSGGKDSIVLVHLARKAFWPAKMPSAFCISIRGIISRKPLYSVMILHRNLVLS